jgi:hypothetical protein
MRWFNKGKPKELWDEAMQWPIGDLEAAGKIRDICNSAVGSAEKVGRLFNALARSLWVGNGLIIESRKSKVALRDSLSDRICVQRKCRTIPCLGLSQ